MDTCDQQLDASINAWVEAELDVSPEWGPEKYTTIRQLLEDSTPAVAAE
ncbi:hypothetical protein [Streptomyces sp. MMBL 11-1]|nr:hypothetical protein [Streptomyces sp. MMBL 11-1]